jgi:hypothetical protein
MSVANSKPIVQLLICVPAGLLLGGALLFPFRHSRESALYAFGMVKDALMQKWSKA